MRKLVSETEFEGDSIDLIIDAVDSLRGSTPRPVYTGDIKDLVDAMVAAFAGLYGLQLESAEHVDRDPYEVIEAWQASDTEMRLLYGCLLSRMGVFVTFAKYDDTLVPLVYTTAVEEELFDRDVFVVTDEFAMGRQLPVMLTHSDLSREGCEFLGVHALAEELEARFDDVLRRGYYSMLNTENDDFESLYEEIVVDQFIENAQAENTIVTSLVHDSPELKERARKALAVNAMPTNPLMNVNHPDVIAFENFEESVLEIAEEDTVFGDHFTVDIDENFPLYGDSSLWFAVGTIRTMWSAFPTRMPIYLMPVEKASDGFEFFEGAAIRNPLIEHVFAEEPVVQLAFPAFVEKEEIFDILAQAALDPDDISMDAFLISADVARASAVSTRKTPRGLHHMRMEEIDPYSTSSPVDLAVNNVPFVMEHTIPKNRFWFVQDMAHQLVKRCGSVVVVTPSVDVSEIVRDLIPLDTLDLDGDIYAQLSNNIGDNALFMAEIEYRRNEELYDSLLEALGKGEKVSAEHRRKMLHMMVKSGDFHAIDLFRDFQEEILEYFSVVVATAPTFHLLLQYAPDAVVVAEAHHVDPALLQGNLFHTRCVYSSDPEEEFTTTDWRYASGVDVQLNKRSDLDRIRRTTA